MQFINEAPLYKIVRIAGPKHNLLGLELSADPVEAVTLEALDNTNSEKQLDANEILLQVITGIDRAKTMLGRDFHVKRIQYVSSDTPASGIYVDLTLEILRCIEALNNADNRGQTTF
jgi:hypothetical protein